jgi:hypothetical protein
MTVWWLRAGISILAVALLAACAANESNTYAAQLEFRATSEIGADQQLYVTLEIHNAGEGTFPGDENLAATMELVDSAGLLRGHVDVARLDVLPAGESVWPATWKGHLEAGRYTLRWGSPRYGGASQVELVITASEGELSLGDPAASPIATQGNAPTTAAPLAQTTLAPTATSTAPGATATPTPTAAPAAEVDPTATPLIALARQDLSERLNIAPETIVLVAVQPETFSDTSLGMPLPGQSYAQVLTPGYVIYFQADGVTYTYNAGAGHGVPADGEG